MTDTLIGERVELIDVVRIASATDLFRGKVQDDELRRRVLENAKRLKDLDEFKEVFIRRDLTFAQRKELQLRRAQTSQEPGATQTARGASSVTAHGPNRPETAGDTQPVNTQTHTEHPPAGADENTDTSAAGTAPTPAPDGEETRGN